MLSLWQITHEEGGSIQLDLLSGSTLKTNKKLLSSNDEGRTLHQPQIKSSSHSKPLVFVTILFPLRALYPIPNQHWQEPCAILVWQWNCQLQSKVGQQARTTWCQGHSAPLLLVPDVTTLLRHYHETFVIFPLCGEWFLSVGRLLSVEVVNSSRLSLSHVGWVEHTQDERRLPTSSFNAS